MLNINASSELNPLGTTTTTYNLNVNSGQVGRVILEYNCKVVSAGLSVKGSFSIIDKESRKSHFRYLLIYILFFMVLVSIDSNYMTLLHIHSVSCHPGDFLRPHTITTDQFGAHWEQLQKYNAERSQNIKNPRCNSVDDFMAAASKELNLHAVQVNVLKSDNLLSK